MSVPVWRRELSKADYMYQTYRLAIRIGEIVENGPKKTVIVRLDQSFTWLKKRIHYTPSGKIIMRLVPKNIKDRRACIRKAVSDGRPKECREQSRKSWEGYALKYHGYKSVKSVRNYERSKEELCSMPQKKTSNP